MFNEPLQIAVSSLDRFQPKKACTQGRILADEMREDDEIAVLVKQKRNELEEEEE